MTDVVDRATRSRMMAGIRGKDTQPELRVRRSLHREGLRFRLHGKLPGKPDLVFPKYGAVVFVHGCFWHRHPRCRYAATPASNKDFWHSKLQENVKRDQRTYQELHGQGWRVFVVWECSTGEDAMKSLAKRIKSGRGDDAA
ncbi:MAG: DNA mismatch endonuclease Vsr [Gammaproteobacteria bacterium]|nr:DNA mismatch endonuclease Vsr [Gammaproteobacteria bacterium]